MKLFIAIFFTAMISWPTCADENNPISIEIIKNPPTAWQFRRVNTYVSDKGVRIKGRITANQRFGLPAGHVDIAAYSPSGELIAETTAEYTPRLLTYRTMRKGGVRFSAEITKVLPPSSTIKIAFHSKIPVTKQKPTHEKTIAL